MTTEEYKELVKKNKETKALIDQLKNEKKLRELEGKNTITPICNDEDTSSSLEQMEQLEKKITQQKTLLYLMGALLFALLWTIAKLIS